MNKFSEIKLLVHPLFTFNRSIPTIQNIQLANHLLDEWSKEASQASLNKNIGFVFLKEPINFKEKIYCSPELKDEIKLIKKKYNRLISYIEESIPKARRVIIYGTNDPESATISTSMTADWIRYKLEENKKLDSNEKQKLKEVNELEKFKKNINKNTKLNSFGEKYEAGIYPGCLRMNALRFADLLGLPTKNIQFNLAKSLPVPTTKYFSKYVKKIVQITGAPFSESIVRDHGIKIKRVNRNELLEKINRARNRSIK